MMIPPSSIPDARKIWKTNDALSLAELSLDILAIMVAINNVDDLFQIMKLQKQKPSQINIFLKDEICTVTLTHN